MLAPADEYRFRSRWAVPADPDRVYAALADVACYPVWWPQVRAAHRVHDGLGELRCRSALPYELVFTVRRLTEDPHRRVLAARLDGGLVGTSRWSVTAVPAGSRVDFAQQVRVDNALVRVAGRLVRPALLANHEHMMRAGERGLRRHLLAGTGASAGG